MTPNGRAVLPLATWNAGTWGAPWDLRPLPPEVKAPPEREMLSLINMQRAEIPRGTPRTISVATMYVNLSAAYVQACRYQDALDAATQADVCFTENARIFPSVVKVNGSWHAAAFYNAAVAYVAGSMSNEALDMLAHAELLLAPVRHGGNKRTVTYVVISGAIERLQGQLTGRASAAQGWHDPMVAELDAAVPALVSAADSGDAEAARALAVHAKAHERLDEAIAWYAMAANLGDKEATADAEGLIEVWLQLFASS